MGRVVRTTPWPHYSRERDPVQEAGWDRGLLWTGVENLAPTGN